MTQNSFGIYSASSFRNVSVTVSLRRSETGRRRYGMAFLLTSLATVVSLARAVLLALLIAVVFLGWLAVKESALQSEISEARTARMRRSNVGSRCGRIVLRDKAGCRRPG